MSRLPTIALLLIAALQAQEGESGKSVLTMARQFDLDGDLHEWNLADAHRMSPLLDIFWDAANTPAGISGYIRYARPGSFQCASWNFRLYPRAKDTLNFYTIHGDSVPVIDENTVWRRSKDFLKGVPYVTIEWMMPWSTLTTGQDRQYNLKITSRNACDETLEPVVVQGKRLRFKGSGRAMGPQSLVVLIISVVMFALYLNMRSRFKRR
jgi:hypothetical protein